MRGLTDRRPKGVGAWAIIVSAGGLVGGLIAGGCGGGDENVRDLPRGSRGDTVVREQCGEGGGRVARKWPPSLTTSTSIASQELLRKS